MFNLGFSEILIIGVLALILIGPKQLPEVARVLGRMMNEFKKATGELSGGLLEMKKDLQRPVEEGLQALAKVESQVSDQLSELSEHYHDEEHTIKIDLDQLQKEVEGDETGKADGRKS